MNARAGVGPGNFVLTIKFMRNIIGVWSEKGQKGFTGTELYCMNVKGIRPMVTGGRICLKKDWFILMTNVSDVTDA